MRYIIIIFGILGSLPFYSLGQDISSATTTKFIQVVEKKYHQANQQINTRYKNYLKKLVRLDRKISNELTHVSNIDSIYHPLRQNLGEGTFEGLSMPYLPGFDSIQTSINYLAQFGSDQIQKTKNLEVSLTETYKNLQKYQAVSVWVDNRKELLGQIPGSNALKQLKAFKQQAYYLKSSVEQYRQLINNTSATEQKMLQLLNAIPAFRDFMAKNSMLATLFPEPQNMGTDHALVGLQTSEQVKGLIHQTVQKGGPDGSAFIQQEVTKAKSELNKLQQKITQAGGNNSDFDMPDFKVNNQRKRTFFNRLEIGTNLQTGKSVSLLPTTTDMGLSVGYRITDKSVAGIGACYKMGWSGNVRQLSVSHQGVGIRSYFEYQLKHTFWLAAGVEMNYRSAFIHVAELQNYSAWQQSGLFGISKRYQISKNFKGNMQLMWDVLSYQQEPKTQPLIFRLGYSLK
jgi:hypothetical protein